MPRTYEQIIKNVANYGQLATRLTQASAAAEAVKQEIKNRKIPAFNMVIEDEAQKWQQSSFLEKIKNFEKILVIGVGGSSLGAKTFCALRMQDRVKFLESIDPQTISDTLNEINLSNCFFLVISKSGETIETICQTLILIDRLQNLYGKGNFGEKFIFITETLDNSLARIAKKIGSEILPHPQGLGGRFSCFSIVGLLPAMLAGIDVKKIIASANSAIEAFISSDSKNCQIIESCASQLLLREHGFVSNVLMPYIDNFKNFVDWYRQLWAESLAKNGFNATLINSQGTVDQHSQLQLYLDGSRDKFFTFITRKNYDNDFSILDLVDCPTLFGGKKLSQIMGIEEQTTIESLRVAGLPIREFRMDSADGSAIASLMIQMMLETLIIAKVNGIDPFNQPAVELRKDMAKKLLKNF